MIGRVSLTSFLILLAVAGSFPASAEESKNFRFGLEGTNAVFTSEREAIAGSTFRLAVKDGQLASIKVELVDIFSDSTGAKKAIPLGSSPFSPEGLVTFTEITSPYEPSADFQYFDVSFRFSEDLVPDRPVLGGLSISLVPENPAGDQKGVQSSIVGTFAYLPATGINLDEYAPSLTLTGPTIERVTPDFFPLNLLPNFPFALNHGDVQLKYQLSNSGKIFLETSTDMSVEQFGLFGQQDKEVFSDSVSAFLVPGQLSAEAIEVSPAESESQLLGIGLYRFTTTATGEMGDQITTSTSNQQLLVVFPWKQTLLALVLLVVFRKRVFRAFGSLREYGIAIRDFRNSRRKEPKTSLRTLASRLLVSFQPTPSLRTFASRILVRFQPKPKVEKEPTVIKAEREVRPEMATPKTRPTVPVIRNPYTSPGSASTEPRPLYPFWYQPPKKGSDN